MGLWILPPSQLLHGFPQIGSLTSASTWFGALPPRVVGCSLEQRWLGDVLEKNGVGLKIWRQTNPFLFAHGASFWEICLIISLYGIEQIIVDVCACRGGDLPHHQMGMNLEPMLLCWDPNSFGTHQSFRETPINFQRSDSWRLSQVQTFQGWQWLREWFVGLWHVVTEKHGNFHEMWEIKPSRTDCWFQKHVFLYFSPLSITTWDNHPNFGHVLDMGCVG